MSKFYIPIPVPAIICRIGIWFLLRYRKIRYGSEFLRIKLSCGKNESKNKYAIVDPDDYQELSQYNWQYYEKNNRVCYALRLAGRQIFSMHREIMNAPTGKVVDHKDRDGLNNTKQNLRIATVGENNRNCGKMNRPTTSKYKGVHLAAGRGRKKKWQASIRYNKIHKYLGAFETEEEAAKTYDQAAKKYHGEFAALNFE